MITESPYLLKIKKKKKKNWKDFDWQSEVDDQQVSKISPSWIVSENDSLSALVSIKA